MPKRMLSDPAVVGGGLGMAVLPTWQPMGLSLAVIAGDVYNGSGVLVFGLMSAGVVWALHRLHAHAPRSPSTADLIGSALGAAPARAVGVIQFAAYVLIGAYTAKSIGLLALTWTTDPIAAAAGWWWPALSVAAAAVATALVSALPTRVLATVVTVLAAFGLLVFFYVALAVLARVASGTEPVEIGTSAPSSELGPVAVVIPLAIGLAGFEIPTAASDRLRSVGRPLGWAMVLVVVCGATGWVAATMGASGGFRYDSAGLVLIVSEMFGESGSLWLFAASVATATAALLVLVWGATRVARPLVDRGALGIVVTAVVMALLVVAMCRGWGDASAKLWGVAGILLIIVYALAARANSRLDEADTMAWAVFALMGVVLAAVVAVVLYGQGGGEGRWPVAIAAVIGGVAAALAAERKGLRRRLPR